MEIYKFKKVIEKGDEKLRFIIIEDRGPNVLVKEITLFNDRNIPPTFVYPKKDLEPCGTLSEGR